MAQQTAAETAMTIGDAINTLTHFSNLFRATQQITEALEVARQVESNKAAFEAEIRQLEAARAASATERQEVEAERVKLATELAGFRQQAQRDTIMAADDENRKRASYAQTTETLLISETSRQREIQEVTAGIEGRRDALMKEIHLLEDKRDKLKGLGPAVAPSAQVRLPHEL